MLSRSVVGSLLSGLVAAVVVGASACPPAEGEGEGEGDAAEGEGDAAEGEGDAAEGEGDVAGEGEGDVAGEGEGEAGGNLSWTADGTAITDAVVDPLVDVVAVPAAGITILNVSGHTANFGEQMLFGLTFNADPIPAGTYTCGSLPVSAGAVGNAITVSFAHAGVAAHSGDNVLGLVGACSITIDNDVTLNSHVTGTFSATGVLTGAAGADIVITNGAFDLTDH